MNAPIFSNHGCRLNMYETEAMKELAGQSGLTDTVVVNTCAVTAEAVQSQARYTQAASHTPASQVDRNRLRCADRA